MMSNHRVTFAIALLASGITGLPSPRSHLGRYPLTEHYVDLYRTALPYVGNFEGDITVGSQTVRAVLDTGSSNTWFMDPGFQCLNSSTHDPIPANQCGYDAPRLVPDASFQPIPDEHFNLTYLNGEFIIATPGYDKLVFAGLDVPKQRIGLAETAAVSYPGKATGLIGMAFRLETDWYPGNDPSKDVACGYGVGVNNTGCNEHHYSPLLSTMFSNGLVPPLFAFALSRGAPKAGIFTLGGLPDVHDPQINITSQSVEATVAIEKLKDTIGYEFYTITIDDLHYNGASAGAGKAQYIVDTGTVQTIVPAEEAKKINSLFDPPARYSEEFGEYFVQCNATGPEYGVEIGGKTFMINPKDLVLTGINQIVEDLPGPICTSAVVPGDVGAEGPGVLGSTFLRNVLAVFDVGEKEMTFASRVYYEE